MSASLLPASRHNDESAKSHLLLLHGSQLRRLPTKKTLMLKPVTTLMRVQPAEVVDGAVEVADVDAAAMDLVKRHRVRNVRPLPRDDPQSTKILTMNSWTSMPI